MEREHISYKKWAKHLQALLLHLEKLLWPDLFIVGGSVAEYKGSALLNLQTPIVPASLRNGAGTIGAALAASLRVGANVPPGAQRTRRCRPSGPRQPSPSTDNRTRTGDGGHHGCPPSSFGRRTSARVDDRSAPRSWC